MSIAANSSFVNGGNDEDHEQESDSDDDDDSDDELECDNLGINVNANESSIENMLNNINLSVMQLRPQPPNNTSSRLSGA